MKQITDPKTGNIIFSKDDLRKIRISRQEYFKNSTPSITPQAKLQTQPNRVPSRKCCGK